MISFPTETTFYLRVETPLTCTQRWELKYLTLSQCYGRNRQLAALRSHEASWPHSQGSPIGSMAFSNSLNPCEQQFPQHKAGRTALLCEKTWRSFRGHRGRWVLPGTARHPQELPSETVPGHPQRHVTQGLAIWCWHWKRFSGRCRTPQYWRECSCRGQLCLQEAIGQFPFPFHTHITWRGKDLQHLFLPGEEHKTTVYYLITVH